MGGGCGFLLGGSASSMVSCSLLVNLRRSAGLRGVGPFFRGDMKLTRSVGYAVGILLRVASVKTSGPMTASAIAEGCEFPPRFLYRVLRRLVDAGLLQGVSGPGGGYQLARPPKDITLLDVVSAIDGPPSPSLLEPSSRRQKKSFDLINSLCAAHVESCTHELSKLTLAKLVAAGK